MSRLDFPTAGEETAHQGLAPLRDRLQLPVPGESPGSLACVTSGKSLPISGPRFPHLQEKRMCGCTDMISQGPSQCKHCASFEKQPAPRGRSSSPGVYSARALENRTCLFPLLSEP